MYMSSSKISFLKRFQVNLSLTWEAATIFIVWYGPYFQKDLMMKEAFCIVRNQMAQCRNSILYPKMNRMMNLVCGDINIKSYDPVLRSGQELSFSLRGNPIVSKRDKNGKQHRHDVVMDEKFRMKKENSGKDYDVNISEIVQQKGVEWLQKKAEASGFSIEKEQVRADGYCNHKFYKPNRKHNISFNTIDFTGVLTVTDPEMFKKVLFEGIGPAKGFGCGLLMVRPRSLGWFKNAPKTKTNHNKRTLFTIIP